MPTTLIELAVGDWKPPSDSKLLLLDSTLCDLVSKANAFARRKSNMLAVRDVGYCGIIAAVLIGTTGDSVFSQDTSALDAAKATDRWRETEAIAIAYRAGYKLAEERKHAEAVVYLRTAVEGMNRIYGPKDPRTVHASVLLGKSYYRSGNYEQACPLFEGSLQSLPKESQKYRIQTFAYLGSIYSKRREYVHAIYVLDQGVQDCLDGDQHRSAIPLLTLLAFAHIELNCDDDAATALSQALCLCAIADEKDAELVLLLADLATLIQWKLGNVPSALSTLEYRARLVQQQRRQMAF